MGDIGTYSADAQAKPEQGAAAAVERVHLAKEKREGAREEGSAVEGTRSQTAEMYRDIPGDRVGG